MTVDSGLLISGLTGAFGALFPQKMVVTSPNIRYSVQVLMVAVPMWRFAANAVNANTALLGALQRDTLIFDVVGWPPASAGSLKYQGVTNGR